MIFSIYQINPFDLNLLKLYNNEQINCININILIIIHFYLSNGNIR